jgi:thioredoxin-dependent peroxiredoxin
MSLGIGQPAPNASGTLPDRSTFSVHGARGRALVLFFYPKDFTVGCTREVCSFRDSFAELSERGGARVVGVSRDDEESHARFIAEHRLPYELVSDLRGEMASAYGTKRLGGLISLQKRLTYVIDAEGIIRGIFHHELDIGAHVDDVRRCLASIAAAKA